MSNRLVHADDVRRPTPVRSAGRCDKGLTVKRARPHDIVAFAAEKTEFHIAYAGGRAIAMGGFVRVQGKLWASFDVKRGVKQHGFAVLLAVRRALSNVHEAVYVQCRSKKAQRLLGVLGFVPAGEHMNDLEVWVWRN